MTEKRKRGPIVVEKDSDAAKAIEKTHGFQKSLDEQTERDDKLAKARERGSESGGTKKARVNKGKGETK